MKKSSRVYKKDEHGALSAIDMVDTEHDLAMIDTVLDLAMLDTVHDLAVFNMFNIAMVAAVHGLIYGWYVSSRLERVLRIPQRIVNLRASDAHAYANRNVD